MTVLGMGLGYLVYEAKRQRKVVAELERLGAGIEFFKGAVEPSWLPDVLDTGYLARIEKIDFTLAQVSDVTVLGQMKNLKELDLEDTASQRCDRIGRIEGSQMACPLRYESQRCDGIGRLEESRNS